MVPIDPRDRELLAYVHRRGGADVQDLCDLLGVTRNAIRQRISRLESGGLLTSTQRSQERGRPKNIYQISDEGLHSLGEDYRELAVVLWQVIVGIEDSAVKEQLIGQVRDQLAKRMQGKLSATSDLIRRVDEFAEEMTSSGFNFESDHSNPLPILRETNCPFPLLAEVDETICHIEREVLEQVLGTSVEFSRRCRDGHHCCEFEVQLEGAGSG